MTGWLGALTAIVWREFLRFIHQRERFLSALVRPLVWLVVFAAGFRAALGVSITPPYQTYITYETYIVPGLCGMILLFNSLQSSLSLVYDREMGSMRLLLTSPLPRWWLLVCRLIGSTAISTRSTGSRARQSASLSPKELVSSGAASSPFTRTAHASMRCAGVSAANRRRRSVNCNGGGS